MELLWLVFDITTTTPLPPFPHHHYHHQQQLRKTQLRPASFLTLDHFTPFPTVQNAMSQIWRTRSRSSTRTTMASLTTLRWRTCWRHSARTHQSGAWGTFSMTSIRTVRKVVYWRHSFDMFKIKTHVRIVTKYIKTCVM